MVIACLFLQTDLHWDNQRVRRRKPHVIDLENCLIKEATDLTQTLITGAYDRDTHGTEGYFRTVFCADSEKTWSPLKEEYVLPSEGYNVNQLYLFLPSDKQAWHVQTFEMPNQPQGLAGIRIEVVKGISECLRVMQKSPTEQGDGKWKVTKAVRTWIDAIQLDKCIVRYVPRTTPTFLGAIRTYIDDLIEEQLKSEKDRNYNQVLDNFIKKQQQSARNEGPRPGYQFDLLETTGRNGQDYKQLDVPAWYRRVDSVDVLSSSGRAVKGFFKVTGLKLLEQSFSTKLDPAKTKSTLGDFIRFLKIDVDTAITTKKGHRRGKVKA
jgi:hypothetical protein